MLKMFMYFIMVIATGISMLTIRNNTRRNQTRVNIVVVFHCLREVFASKNVLFNAELATFPLDL